MTGINQRFHVVFNQKPSPGSITTFTHSEQEGSAVSRLARIWLEPQASPAQPLAAQKQYGGGDEVELHRCKLQSHMKGRTETCPTQTGNNSASWLCMVSMALPRKPLVKGASR